MHTIPARLYSSLNAAIPKALKTIWWLLKLILPISLLVSFLQYWGAIAFIAAILKPAFSIIGLPGESAIVFITSIFLPLYGPIAIIATLPLTMREITILALMCLVSHNLIVETAIQRKTGSSAVIMFFMRIMVSLIGAFILNMLLPIDMGSNHEIHNSIRLTNVGDMLVNWLTNSGSLVLKMSIIVTGLMILQSILKEFNLLTIISKIFAPIMRIMGLQNDSSFLWFVAQTVGLTYGSVIMIEGVNNKEITPVSLSLLNYHIAVNHSLLEDTLLFVAIGVPAGWIIFPRFIFAIVIVWAVKIWTNFRVVKMTNKVK